MRKFQDIQSAVDSWLSAIPSDLSSRELIDFFEESLRQLWTRTSLTLSEITVGAIFDRVFYNASERYPPLSKVKIVPDKGLSFEELKRSADEMDSDQVLEQLRFCVTEYLAIVGSLTKHLILPDLRFELSQLTPKKRAPDA